MLAISVMSCSGITPGPLGISDTKPRTEAPYCIASPASLALAMQQILTLGFLTVFMADLCYYSVPNLLSTLTRALIVGHVRDVFSHGLGHLTDSERVTFPDQLEFLHVVGSMSFQLVWQEFRDVVCL